MSESTAASPVVTVATNTDGWFKSVSPAFLALIAQPVEALAGVNVVDLVHPLDAASARGLIAAASAGPEATLRFLTANDEWSPMRVRTSVQPDGRINFVLVPGGVQAAGASGAVESGGVQAAGASGAVESGGVRPTDANSGAAPLELAAGTMPAELIAGRSAGVPDPSTGAPPSLRGDLAGDFPYADSEEHMDYVESRPSVDIATERAAVRESATSDGATALLEVDTRGRTVFVSGEWQGLIEAPDEDEGPVPSMFERLLGSTGQGEVVLGNVHRAIRPGETGDAIVQLDGAGLHRVRVEPVASPLLAGVNHALVSVAPAPPGATVSAVGDPSWSAAAALAPAEADPATAAEPDEEVEPDALTAETGGAASEAAGSPAEIEPETRRRRLWVWLALGALLLVALWALFGRSGDTVSEMGPVEVEVVPSDPVEVEPGQTWRSLGVAGLSDLHGIAATDDGALVGSFTGRIVRVDETGLAQSMVVVGDPGLTALSDIAADSDGTSWALDAGLAQIYRVSPDGEVTILEPNSDPLRNARGIALGSDDTLWVASTASSQLVRIGRDGGIVSTLLQPGRQPSDVVELDDGSLWYVDAELLELVHVSSAGETISTLPIESFFSNEAPHLAVIGDVMWVTEPAQGSVFSLDLTTDQPTGERINLIRPEGERVERPIGLTADPDGRLWTVDSLGRATITLDN